MKCRIFYLLFLLSISLNAQDRNLFSNSYILGEINYRSYGTGDITGIGYGVEISKDIKKWIGVGVNLSYWSNQKLSWDFANPFTGFEYRYYDQINDLRLSSFLQLLPLNTKYVDLYIQGGLVIDHYNQVRYNGGFSTDNFNQIFDVFILDDGDKVIDFGYEFGGGLRFEINQFTIVPQIILISNNTRGNSFSGLNLKLGWHLK